MAAQGNKDNTYILSEPEVHYFLRHYREESPPEFQGLSFLSFSVFSLAGWGATEDRNHVLSLWNIQRYLAQRSPSKDLKK